MSYEEASNELENIIAKLENGSITMSEAMQLFDRGAELAKICFSHLEKAKGKITEVKMNLGKLTEEDNILPF